MSRYVVVVAAISLKKMYLSGFLSMKYHKENNFKSK